MTKPIAIYGAGGLGREVLMLIHQINQSQPKQWQPIGFFDDGFIAGSLVHGLPVLGGLAMVNTYPTPLAIVMAIGNPKAKKQIVGQLQNSQLYFPTLIHPTVQLLPEQNITIDVGCVICAGVCLTVDVTIGRFVLLNLHTTVGHDAQIGDFCSIMPSVTISGEVTLDEGVYAGAASSFIQQIRVGEFATVGLNAAVIRSLPSHCTAVGIPAKPLKFYYPTNEYAVSDSVVGS